MICQHCKKEFNESEKHILKGKYYNESPYEMEAILEPIEIEYVVCEECFQKLNNIQNQKIKVSTRSI